MKKFIIILTAFCLLTVSLSACKNTDGDVIPTDTSAEVTVPNIPTDITSPIDATFVLDNATDGFANATVTVTMPEKYNADTIRIFWADKNGIPLENYTSLAPFKITGTKTEYKISDYSLIPEGAANVLIYATVYGGEILSENAIMRPLPEGCAAKDFGKPLFEMQIASDIHLQAEYMPLEPTDYLPDLNHNKNFITLLKNIKEISPDSIGLFINGDIAHNGLDSEFRLMYEYVEKYNNALDIYMSIGNHDFYDSRDEWDYTSTVNMFLNHAKYPNGTNPDSLSYDFWLNDHHFVVLGTDIFPPENIDAYLSDETLEWLDNTLSLNRDISKPTFIFLHQGIYDTVAGTLPGEDWDGVVNHKDFSAVLKKYPEAILLTSHSHWPMHSKSNIHYRDNDLPTILNTSAVAYLCDNYYGDPAIDTEGGNSYFVYVYEDKVVFRGWDILEQKWISSAQYVVDYSDGAFDTTIAESNFGAKFVGIQGRDTSDQTSLRLLATIDKLDYKALGFTVKISYKQGDTTVSGQYDLYTTDAYTDIWVNGSVQEAALLGGKYVYAVSLPYLGNYDGDISIELSPYVLGNDGKVYDSSPVNLTYNSGTVTYK